MTQPIHRTSVGGSEIAINGLTADELEQFQGALNGTQWITVRGGRLVALSVYDGLPDPVEDPLMHPIWRRPSDEEITTHQQLFLFDEDRFSDHSSPSIQISSVCGYNYSPENYEREAEKLLLYGFEMLRSQRGTDGRYWEVFILHSAWAAKGDLLDHLNHLKHQTMHDGQKGTPTSKQQTDAMIEFLCREVQFGRLDVVVQRAAMVWD
jgi:hypothetical protein